jgi:hypothetical protein
VRLRISAEKDRSWRSEALAYFTLAQREIISSISKEMPSTLTL